MKKLNIAWAIVFSMAVLVGCGKTPVNSSAVSSLSNTTSLVSDVGSSFSDTSSEGLLSSTYVSSGVSETMVSSSSTKSSTTPSNVNTSSATSSSKTTYTITSKSTEPSSTIPPAPKSIYDRPYDIVAIEKDMEQYVKSKGGNYEWSMNMDNFGWWIDPLPTSPKWVGEKLKNEIEADLAYRMSLGRYKNFRVFFNPISGEEFEITVLCG